MRPVCTQTLVIQFCNGVLLKVGAMKLRSLIIFNSLLAKLSFFKAHTKFKLVTSQYNVFIFINLFMSYLKYSTSWYRPLEKPPQLSACLSTFSTHIQTAFTHALLERKKVFCIYVCNHLRGYIFLVLGTFPLHKLL